ncbi:Anaphase-promoting complex subunit 10 [Hordeum vulgare]|nr:Anaphase-promoting complex subunit 10 [Hordeum vulgare]
MESDGEDEAAAPAAGRLKGCPELTVEGDMREIAKTAAWSVSSCKPGNGVASLHDDSLDTYWQHDVLNVSQGLLQELGIYLLSFDRPGYCESDAHPAWTEESIAVDIAELADNLQLGARFHLMGFSMGGEIMWSCLKHIPHRQ